MVFWPALARIDSSKRSNGYLYLITQGVVLAVALDVCQAFAPAFVMFLGDNQCLLPL